MRVVAFCNLNTLSHRQPGELTFGAALLGAKHAEVSAVVDGRFDAQEATEFIVGFQAVGVDSVLDTHTFGPMLDIGGNFAVKVSGDAAVVVESVPQKAHDIRTRQAEHAVAHQVTINRLEPLGVAKHKICGPLTLIRSPVVVGGSTFEHLVVERMGIALQVSEQLRPSDLKLLIHELLGCGHVFDPPKAIVSRRS